MNVFVFFDQSNFSKLAYETITKQDAPMRELSRNKLDIAPY